MDSITQIALGAGVAEAVMQNKVGRRASLWGAVCGTLPDLDVLIPMGNAVKDFTYHRAESHAFFYMALATPIIVWLIMKIHPQTKSLKFRWLAAVFLSLITHSLLDSHTVYGTQMLLPFSDYPIGWSTIFVIDPLYTIPLLIGVGALYFMVKNPRLALKMNLIGIIISTSYLIWSYGAKGHVNSVAERSLADQNYSITKTLSTPSPFNTLLWRIIAMTDSGYVEGFYSILDESDDIKFNSYLSQNELIGPLAEDWNVKRLQWFTKGFYEVSNVENKIVITDLRMGVSGLYFFRFTVGEKTTDGTTAAEVEKLAPEEFNSIEPLKRLWHRIWDEEVGLF